MLRAARRRVNTKYAMRFQDNADRSMSCDHERRAFVENFRSVREPKCQATTYFTRSTAHDGHQQQRGVEGVDLVIEPGDHDGRGRARRGRCAGDDESGADVGETMRPARAAEM